MIPDTSACAWELITVIGVFSSCEALEAKDLRFSIDDSRFPDIVFILSLNSPISSFLFIEIFYTEDKEKQLQIQDKLEEKIKELKITVDKVIFADKIPVDKRHNGKIDYGSLERLSEKYI